jgi:hypothetical protein
MRGRAEHYAAPIGCSECGIECGTHLTELLVLRHGARRARRLRRRDGLQRKGPEGRHLIKSLIKSMSRRGAASARVYTPLTIGGWGCSDGWWRGQERRSCAAALAQYIRHYLS